MEKISVIIPAYNEEDSICQTIDSLKGIEEVDEIIVVDDGSTDNTSIKLMSREDIILVKKAINKGKGAAVSTGLTYVKNKYVMLLDADLRESAAEAGKLLAHIEENRMVIGVFSGTDGKNGFGITKKVAAVGMRLLAECSITSLLSGQRIMPIAFLKSVKLPEDYSMEFKLTLEAIRSGVQITEVPVMMQHREYGRTLNGFFHRGKQCREILKLIAKEVVDGYIYSRPRN